MSRKTALVLVTLIVGALLWSALADSDGSDEAPPTNPRRAAEDARSKDAAMLASPAAADDKTSVDSTRARGSSAVRLMVRILKRGAALQSGDVLVWQLVGTAPHVARGVATLAAAGWTPTGGTCGWDEEAQLAPHADPGQGVDLIHDAVPPGRYRLDVRVRSGTGASGVSAPPQELLVSGPKQTVEVLLEEESRDARLELRAERGSQPYEGPITYRVLRDGRPVELDAPKVRQPDGLLAVAALVTLEVQVEAYPSMSLFPAVPPVTVQLEPGEHRVVHFTLPAGRPVGIQCLTPHGERVPASLTLWRYEGQRQLVVDVAAALREEKDTWWGYLPPGKWFARMGPRSDYASAGLRFETTRGEELQLLKVHAGTDGRRVRLRLRNAADELVDKEQFNLNRIGSDNQQSDFYIGSLTRGEAVSRPLPEGRYWLFLWGRGYARRVELKEAVDVVIDERLPAPLAPDDARPGVRGRIVDHGRQPLGAVRVLCRAEDSSWHWMTRTKRDGSFTFEGLAPGAYEVVVPGALLDKRMRRGASKKVLLTRAAAEVTIRLPPR